MGNYAWERGSIKLPPAEYRRVRDAMRRYIEADLDEAFRLSQLYWSTLPRWARKSPFNPMYAFLEGETWYGKTPIPAEWGDRNWRIENGLTCNRWLDNGAMRDHIGEYLYRQEYNQAATWTYHRQRKSDMPKLTGATWRLNFQEITIAFVEGNTVEYDSGYNKSQPERARNHPWVAKLLELLETVAWTSRSGGSIYGNDEYHQEGADGPGGGGNYFTGVYGGLGEREYKRVTGFKYTRPRMRGVPAWT